jgi:hypothetical protein
VQVRHRVAVDLVVHLRRLEQLAKSAGHEHRLFPEGGAFGRRKLKRLDGMLLRYNAGIAGQWRLNPRRDPGRVEVGDDIERSAAGADGT